MNLSVSNMQPPHQQMRIEQEEGSIVVPLNQRLHFIYYAIARVQNNHVENFFERTIEEVTDINLNLRFPKPPGPIGSWSLVIYGYRDEQRVFQNQIALSQIF